MFEGVGELQAGQEEHRLQKLLQPLQSLHAAGHGAASLDHLVDVLSETLAHLRATKTLSSLKYSLRKLYIPSIVFYNQNVLSVFNLS